MGGEKFLFLSASVLDLFSDDHVIHSRFGSVTKEKRKRGRPTKSKADKLREQQAAEAAKIDNLIKVEKESPKDHTEESLDEGVVGRRKRKIKLPSRYQEVVQVLNSFFIIF